MLHPEIEELFSLTGQVAVVTGAGAGIGRGIAVRLAQAGAEVTVADRDPQGAEQVAAELRRLGGRALALTADVSDEAAVGQMVERTVAEFGRLDILINNAGIYPARPLAKLTVEEWDQVMAVNLRGVFLCTRTAAAAMRAGNRGGRVVNMSSIESFRPSLVGVSAYSTSKGGLNLFTQSAALELARDGITVNAVCPGAVLTEGTAAAFAAGLQKMMEARIPLKRVTTPAEVSAAVLFLASKAAGYITGTTLLVDGGYLLA
ncbi:MAG: SDR family oxidoreductase [Deltaproteobacteria bacterium]|nr:SDR family oxidoreductase [Deltaproteobacteria bacterium]